MITKTKLLSNLELEEKDTLIKILNFIGDYIEFKPNKSDPIYLESDILEYITPEEIKLIGISKECLLYKQTTTLDGYPLSVEDIENANIETIPLNVLSKEFIIKRIFNNIALRFICGADIIPKYLIKGVLTKEAIYRIFEVKIVKPI